MNLGELANVIEAGMFLWALWYILDGVNRAMDRADEIFGFLVTANASRKYFQRKYKIEHQKTGALEVDLRLTQLELRSVLAMHSRVLDAIVNREPITVKMPGRIVEFPASC